MANPSLQIGNSNWAIKEDNLLGYSTAGTRFIPQPITMTRASAGTRVNSSGLVETVELLGSELVSNGNFTGVTNGTDVITLSGWGAYGSPTSRNVVDNKLVIVATGGNQGAIYTVGSLSGTYKLSVDVTGDVGAGAIYIESPASYNITTSVGTVDYYFVASGTTSIYFRAASNSAGTTSYTNISVKESTKNNLARVDYDGTASSLLVEPERTNDITNSETFGSTGWSEVLTGTAIAPIVTDNYAISPDGTQNAQRIQYNLGGGTSYSDRTIIRQGISTQTDWFLSVFLKSATGVDQKILWHTASDSDETTITNEWKRYELNKNGSSNSWFGLGLRGSVSTVDTCDVLVYGLQAEQGSYPTSYIPTSGSTVTRVQDQYSKTGISNLINSTEGTFFVEMAALANSGETRAITISNGTNNNRLQMYYSTADNTIYLYSSIDSVFQFSTTFTITDNTAYNKFGFSWGLNDFKIYVNGVPKYTNATFSPPISGVFDRINLSEPLGINHLFAKVRQLQLYKTALTPTQLATLTT